MASSRVRPLTVNPEAADVSPADWRLARIAERDTRRLPHTMTSTLATVQRLFAAPALIMAGLGLSLKVEDFRRIASERRAVAVGMALQFLVRPATAQASAGLTRFLNTRAVQRSSAGRLGSNFHPGTRYCMAIASSRDPRPCCR